MEARYLSFPTIENGALEENRTPMMRMETSHSAIELQVHEIEKESGGGLEPLQPSLASTRWRMGHPPIVRMIPKLFSWLGIVVTLHFHKLQRLRHYFYANPHFLFVSTFHSKELSFYIDEETQIIQKSIQILNTYC